MLLIFDGNNFKIKKVHTTFGRFSNARRSRAHSLVEYVNRRCHLWQHTRCPSIAERFHEQMLAFGDNAQFDSHREQ
jgi:hypothetical protein